MNQGFSGSHNIEEELRRHKQRSRRMRRIFFEVSEYFSDQWGQIYKLCESTRRFLDEKYTYPKEGAEEIDLRFLILEAKCRFDFDAPDVRVIILKSRYGYIPDLHMCCSYEILDRIGFRIDGMREHFQGRFEHYSKSVEEGTILAKSALNHLAAALYRRILERFFSGTYEELEP